MYEHETRQDYPEAGREWCRALPLASTRLWPIAVQYLVSRELNARLAGENHWFASYRAGDEEARVVIPATSMIAGNVFWQARAIDSNVAKRYQSPHAPRGDAIIAVWPSEPGHVTTSAVVEGPMDALAAAGEGVLGIALMGVTPPESALDLTAKLVRGTIVTVVADSDAVGSMSKVLLKLALRGALCRLSYPGLSKDLAGAGPTERKRILMI